MIPRWLHNAAAAKRKPRASGDDPKNYEVAEEQHK